MNAAAKAAALAKKLNRKLAASGKLSSTENKFLAQTSSTHNTNNHFVKEIEINNFSANQRSLLTKGQFHDAIASATKASVTTRGAYMNPEERQKYENSQLTHAHVTSHMDRPLYLHIEASTESSLAEAVEMINAVIGSAAVTDTCFHYPFCSQPLSSQSQPPPGSHMFAPPYAYPPVPVPYPPVYPLHVSTAAIPPPKLTGYMIQDKVYVGAESVLGFDLKHHLLGPNNSYFQHICQQTNSRLQLRGRGSGFIEDNGKEAFERLYIWINNPTQEGMDQAKRLCESLVLKVQADYKDFRRKIGIPVEISSSATQQSKKILPATESSDNKNFSSASRKRRFKEIFVEPTRNKKSSDLNLMEKKIKEFGSDDEESQAKVYKSVNCNVSLVAYNSDDDDS